ncbi:hypothetical protein ACYBSK_13135 [Streptomyces sp. BYX5S]
MTSGWGARAGRAAMFAAVCVLLTALGHTLMSGAAMPWWALGAAFAVTGAVACGAAGRERGLLPVVGLAVVAQGALHLFFSWAQGGTAAHAHGAGGGGMSGMGHAAHDMGGMTGSGMSPTDMSPTDMSATHMSLTDTSSVGMFLAHLLAAVLSGLWLAYGERAAFRVARAVVRRIAAPLRLPLRVPTPPHRPRMPLRRTRRDRAPRVLLLADTITSRGPPARDAVA